METLFTTVIPLNDAIKMGFIINLNEIKVEGSNKTLSQMDLNNAEFILMTSFYGEHWASSSIKGKDFESEHFVEDMDDVTTKLLGISHSKMMLDNHDCKLVFADKCKYPFTVEE
jgi:hypothetical protein